jgi:hypothetical protein
METLEGDKLMTDRIFQSPDRKWYALSSLGSLLPLGDCGDWHVANEIAEDLDLDAVWIADVYTIKQWLAVIAKDLDLKVSKETSWKHGKK